MPITQPYSANPLKISNASGGDTITFDQLKEPRELPEFTFTERNIVEDMTRPSATNPGWRVFGSFGSHDNYMDLSLTLPVVTPAEYATLQGWYNARPGVVQVSLDGGTNTYYAIWKKGGLKASNYSFNQREFHKLQIELYIIGKI